MRVSSYGLMVLSLAFLTGLPTLAADKEGVQFPDQATVGGKTLKLNGIGTRLATFAKIRAYHAGLYLESPSKDPGQILGSPQLKQVRMHFLRKVSRDQITEAWDESFKKNCKDKCDAYRPAHEKLKSYMEDMKKDELMTFNIFPDKVEVEVKGQKKEPIQAEGYPQVFLTTWLGDNPPNKELKKGMLGE